MDVPDFTPHAFIFGSQIRSCRAGERKRERAGRRNGLIKESYLVIKSLPFNTIEEIPRNDKWSK